MVIEQSGRRRAAYDIYSRLLKERIIFLVGPDQRPDGERDRRAAPVLESENPDKDINFYINSRAAAFPPASPSTTRCSSSSPTCQRSAPARREHGPVSCCRVAPRASASRSQIRGVMIHQPSGGFSGQASDIEIHARRCSPEAPPERMMALHTGQTIKVIDRDTDRDHFMGATEA